MSDSQGQEITRSRKEQPETPLSSTERPSLLLKVTLEASLQAFVTRCFCLPISRGRGKRMGRGDQGSLWSLERSVCVS